MTVQNLSAQAPFITKDGSVIRSILDRTNAPVQNQSLAEARVPAGGRTERHYHKVTEELYFILEGAGEIELDGERRMVGPGDAILIPPGTWAHDHGYRAATLSLLLRAALYARGYVFGVTGKATVSADSARGIPTRSERTPSPAKTSDRLLLLEIVRNWKARPLLHPRYGSELARAAWKSSTISTAIM